MAKMKTDPILAKDMLEFVTSKSDLQFEIDAFKTLRSHGFTAQHGGTYTDPVTGIPREFDIRASLCGPAGANIRLAVECKNLHECFPLLISCVPRPSHDAYIQLLVFSQDYVVRKPQVYELTDVLYHSGTDVGKKIDRVGRRHHDSELESDDSEVYDKWAQAVASSFDLAATAIDINAKRRFQAEATVVIPMLVVPNGRLWRVSYDSNGDMKAPPEQCDRVPYYIGHQFNLNSSRAYRVSHLEIVTLEGLALFADRFSSRESSIWQLLFPAEAYATVGA